MTLPAGPPRSRLLRWLARVLVAFAALAVLTTAAIWLTFRSLDFDATVTRLEQAVGKATGRALTIGSRPQLTFTPLLKLVVGDVRLANPPGSAHPEMLTLKEVEIGINLMPLAGGRPPGLRLVLREPSLWLEVTERGQANWKFKLSPEEGRGHVTQAMAVLRGKVVLESVAIERATVRYDNRRAGRVLEIAARQAALEISADARYELTLEGTIGGKPATLDADFRAPAPDKPVSGKLRAILPGATLALEGAVLAAWPMDGTRLKASAAVSNASELAGILGLRLGAVPPVKLDAELHGTANGIRAEALRMEFGRTTLAGTVEADRFEPRLHLRAGIEARQLDVAELLAAWPPQPAAATPPVASGRLIPATPLPLAWLHALDAELQLRAGQLLLPGSRSVESLEVTASLANGRLTVAPYSAAVGSGRVRGELHMDATAGATAAIRTEIHANGVEMGRLVALAGLSSAGFTDGATDAAIRLAARGASVRALMAALDGDARVVVGSGRLPGKAADWSRGILGQALDVMNPYRKSEDGSLLKCAVVNVPVRRGVVTITDTVAAETDKLVASVAGSVNLGEERLDLTLNSRAVKGIAPGLANFTGAARVTGSLASPELAVNAQGAAAAGIRIGAAVATAGISLLAESAAHRVMPAHPCQAALAARADAAPAMDQPAEPQAAGEKRGLLGRTRKK